MTKKVRDISVRLRDTKKFDDRQCTLQELEDKKKEDESAVFMK